MGKMDFPRLSRMEYLIMNLLVGGGEMYGLQLVEKSDGALKRGTIYVTLDRMETKGYITSRREAEVIGGASARRLYKPSGQGVRVYKALEDAGGKAWLREAFAA